jgi:pre-mRNA-processing factor SLU7
MKTGAGTNNLGSAAPIERKDKTMEVPNTVMNKQNLTFCIGPTLKHQRQQEEKIKKYAAITDWYNRGVDTNKIATKFRKGACENCGAVTHKRKDCLGR